MNGGDVGGSRAATDAASQGVVPLRRLMLRCWLVSTLLLLLNELGTNAYGMYEKFHRAKVLNSLSGEAQLALSNLLDEVLVMLGTTVLLTAGLCLAWAAVSSIAYERWRVRHGRQRVARWLFWFVVGFSFVHVHYSVHNLLLPGSRMCDSPLVIFGGAFDDRLLTWTSPRLLLLPLTSLVVVGCLVWALRASLRLRLVLPSAVTGLVCLAVGYSWLTGVGEVRRFTAPGSVVLLGLDSFQANRLPLGGAPDGIAPRINGFLEESFQFENTWTPFARTYPSWISMLTGRYPARHGVRFNLVPDSHLSPDNRYLPELLRENGYETLHATDETRFSIIRPNFGFERQLHPRMGLPDFLVGSFFDFTAANLVRQTALGHDMFPMIRDNRAVVGYNPRLWVRSFLKELNELPADRPVFVTAHLCGNHWPFTAPYPYWQEESGVQACIAMVDDQVGEILDYLDASGLRELSTVFMLSDHGDGWSGDPEDTTNTHGDHLDRLLANKVIFGVSGPDIESGSTTEFVRTFDLYPTVLELAGVVPDLGAIDGRSLLPVLRGEDTAPRACFAESGFDKKTFLISRLIEEHSTWYEFDPGSELITLKDEGYNQLLSTKSYMLMRGDLRLLLVPGRGTVRVTRFDAVTGDEVEVTDEVPVDVRYEMLQSVLEHYGLDRGAILGMARQRGFLEST